MDLGGGESSQGFPVLLQDACAGTRQGACLLDLLLDAWGCQGQGFHTFSFLRWGWCGHMPISPTMPEARANWASCGTAAGVALAGTGILQRYIVAAVRVLVMVLLLLLLHLLELPSMKLLKVDIVADVLATAIQLAIGSMWVGDNGAVADISILP